MLELNPVTGLPHCPHPPEAIEDTGKVNVCKCDGKHWRKRPIFRCKECGLEFTASGLNSLYRIQQ